MNGLSGFVLGASIVALYGMLLPSSLAQDATAFFESKIRPVLVEHCYECHSVEAGKSKGGLFVDSAEGLRQGGDHGPAVVPGNPLGSVLIHAISHHNGELKMPLKKPKLADSIIDEFVRWIQQGAPDPRQAGSTPKPPSVDYEAARAHWVYRKPTRESPPRSVTADAWVSDPMIDGWVLSELHKAGLKPSPVATPEVLVRRLHFDLTGLPPTPGDVDRFVARVEEIGINKAMTKEADRLLETKAFGERWGRHWLDVARFAESSGKESNLTFPHAWRFRDYVIDAINDDVPFDRFVTEQIAGDLLTAGTKAETARLQIATGFLALGTKSLNEMNGFQFIADLIDEQIDVVGRAFMASSFACARCHDHKSEPYAMEDYYALAGIFLSTKTFFGTAISSENNVGGDLITLPRMQDEVILQQPIAKSKLTTMKAKLAQLNEEEREKKAALKEAIEEGRSAEGIFTIQDALRILWTRGGIEGKLKTVDEEGHPLPLCMGVQDADQIMDAPLLKRGEIAQPGAKVERRYPAVFELEEIGPPSSRKSGRLQLAKWLTHPDHPLTARVFVNRVWRWVFGAGLVRTVDHFGMEGEVPSHPALLDGLAVDFQKSGWSLKKLVRRLVLSQTYRQQSAYRKDAFMADPDNRLLWRMPHRRLEAEAIRDAMLAVSGQLDPKRPKGSLVAGIGDKSVSLFGFDRRVPMDLDGTVTRSVYLPVVRDRLPDVLDLFDFADPSLVTGSRNHTNVPPQALYLLNSGFVQSQAQALADRVNAEVNGDGSLEGFVRHAIRLCFGREAEREEVKMGAAFLESGIEKQSSVEMNPHALYCQALLASAEFRLLE